VSHVIDIINGTVEESADRISLERYVQESSFITRYLSRLVKDQSLVVYHVLFHLSWFETGKGEIIVPWAQVGSFIRTTGGSVIEHSSGVKRRLSNLIEYECISVARQRGNANEISVHLPSDIPVCRELIDREEHDARIKPQEKDERDYYSDPGRRLMVLARDHHACVYCTAALSEESFVLDHLLPVARGGTNRKQNLVAACEVCNRRRSDTDPIHFLRENYRQQLLSQEEFLQQKQYIEALLGENVG
jgi:hypothetical protein